MTGAARRLTGGLALAVAMVSVAVLVMQAGSDGTEQRSITPAAAADTGASTSVATLDRPATGAPGTSGTSMSAGSETAATNEPQEPSSPSRVGGATTSTTASPADSDGDSTTISTAISTTISTTAGDYTSSANTPTAEKASLAKTPRTGDDTSPTMTPTGVGQNTNTPTEIGQRTNTPTGDIKPPTNTPTGDSRPPRGTTTSEGPKTTRTTTSEGPRTTSTPTGGGPRTTVAPAEPSGSAGTPSTVDHPVTNPGLTWGYDNTAPSSAWTRPAVGTATADPAYGAAVRRLTSADGTRFDRNTYSRRQAENADGTHILTYHGSATYRVYDRDRGTLMAELGIHPDAEPQWHPTDPGRIRHLIGPNSYIGGLQLLETTVATGQTRVIADLTDRIQGAVPAARYLKDRAEGSPSRDGRRHAWIFYDGSEQPIGLVAYDLAADRVLGITTELVDHRIDWVSMSVTGRYIVAGHAAGTYVYDADLSNRRLITRALEHSDLALAGDGTDRYVYIDFTSNPETGGWLTSVDLKSLDRVKIFDAFDRANTSMHISGKGYEKPGWIVVSTYNCKVPGAWTCDKVMAVELAANGRVLNLAHTYNCGDNYWTETHAVVNRTFTRVYYNSDGGSCGIDAEVYRLDIPRFR